MSIDISNLDINLETAKILYVKETEEHNLISTYLAEADYENSDLSVIFTVDNISGQIVRYYCDEYISNIKNKFWYDIYTDELVPGKFFGFGTSINSLINLQALSGTIIENANNVRLNAELIPAATENVGKIVWDIASDLAQYIDNVSFDKDTFGLKFSINSVLVDDVFIENKIESTVKITALDISHKNELGNFTWDLNLTGKRKVIAYIMENTLYIESAKDTCEINNNTLKINDKSVSIEGTCLKFT